MVMMRIKSQYAFGIENLRIMFALKFGYENVIFAYPNAEQDGSKSKNLYLLVSLVASQRATSLFLDGAAAS